MIGNRQLEIIGCFTQTSPNNWKLYFENVRDTYHASLLHLFFATFRITRLSSGGGEGERDRRASCVDHAGATTRNRQQLSGPAFRKESFRLPIRACSACTMIKFHDDIQLQILSIFPGFILQQVHNAVAVRQVVPRGVAESDLNWVYLGFKDDTAELRRHRLKQCNLVGPAGFVSMEDGAVGVASCSVASPPPSDELSVVEMGGAGAESPDGDARPRPRCADSGRRIAPIWDCDAMSNAEILFSLAALNTEHASSHRCGPAGGLAGAVPRRLRVTTRITTADNRPLAATRPASSTRICAPC